MKQSKGQASLEYLTTYAWSFMIVLLFIGILYYFGFFNADRYTGQYCQFDSNFYCKDYSINENGNNFDVHIMLQNNMNDEIRLNQTRLEDESKQEIICARLMVYCPFNSSSTYLTASPSNTPPVTNPVYSWTPTRVCELRYTGCPGELAGMNKYNVFVRLNFSGIGRNTTHLSYGTVYAKVN